MRKYKTRGYIDAIAAAVSYGTNPLFFLPLHKMGYEVISVLFYRYFFAVVMYGLWIKFFRKTPLNLTIKEFFSLLFMGIIFSMTSITLFESFKYIDSGIACTILFIYPVIVALISTIFFKEKITKSTVFAMFMALCGIYLLNNGNSENLNPKGVIFVMLSAFIYAIYIVLVKHWKPIKHIKYDKLSFYVMLFGLIVFVVNLKFCTQLQPITEWRALCCALALAFLPTIISIETINVAIHLIGSTQTSIIGALEPITAIFFGVIIFHEVLTVKTLLGIALVLSGVILIILKDSLRIRQNC